MTKYTVSGMSCAACTAAVARAVRAVPGVKDVSVNLLAAEMVVDGSARDEDVLRAVSDAGYRAAVYVPGQNAAQQSAEREKDAVKRRLWLSAAFLVPLFYVAMAPMLSLPLPAFLSQSLPLYAGVQFVLAAAIGLINRDLFVKGYASLFRGAPTMNALVALGCTASGVYGTVKALSLIFTEAESSPLPALYFESFGMILTLVTLGRFLESRARKKTTDSVSALLDLSPKTVRVRRDGKEMLLDVKEVREHDVVLVRAGESLAADGVVTAGTATLDTSVMTGESMPATVQSGDCVRAGAHCLRGYFEFEATKVGNETALAALVEYVKNASASKPPIQRLADRVCGVFVPAVMAVALLTAAVWLCVTGDVARALTYGVCVLVVACPCALGIATPVAVAVGTGRGAQKGILLRDAEALEALARIDTVVFDKTGTLTEGKPAVSRVVCLTASEAEIVRLCASAERYSEHPLAAAVLERAEGLTLEDVSDYETLTGLGIRAETPKGTVYAGNEKLMNTLSLSCPDVAKDGETVIWVALNDTLLGALTACDALRSTSAPAIRELHALGLSTVLLTGDNEKSARAAADKAGISDVTAGVMPEDKASYIDHLCQSGKHVLMVGDGVNDAPSLVRADVGAAVGSGADVTLESADVILTTPGVCDVPGAVRLGRATVKTVKMGLFWAFFYNTAGILLASGAFSAWGVELTPIIAAAMMSASSLCVVLNALRLTRFPLTTIKEDGMMNIKLTVNGMHCEHCVAAVKKALEAVEGVASADVNLKKKSAVVTAADTVGTDALISAVRDAGFEARA